MPPFKLEAHKAVKKDLRKISTQASGEIVNSILPQIARNPFDGIALTGTLRGFFKFVFHLEGISYRIVYQINEDEKIVLVLAIGTRENFYQRLLKKLK